MHTCCEWAQWGSALCLCFRSDSKSICGIFKFTTFFPPPDSNGPNLQQFQTLLLMNLVSLSIAIVSEAMRPFAILYFSVAIGCNTSPEHDALSSLVRAACLQNASGSSADFWRCILWWGCRGFFFVLFFVMTASWTSSLSRCHRTVEPWTTAPEAAKPA